MNSDDTAKATGFSDSICNCTQEVKELSKEEYPGTKGGKIGGRAAATKSTSAAAIAKMLSGLEFPKNKNELVECAKGNRDKVDNAESAIDTVKELPTRTYHSTN
jgi:hypothetical protein